MLTFNLKKEWYKKIRSGEKTIEYREVKPYWRIRLYHAGCFPYPLTWVSKKEGGSSKIHCILRLGYTKRHMTAQITEIEIMNGKDTDLAIDAPVYAIHLADVREEL